MLISNMNPELLRRDQITKLLFGSADDTDNGNLNGDCIVVLGGPYLSRAKKAAELFHAGRAPYIMFTGGNIYGQRNIPEAVVLKNEAIKLGVPEESILAETQTKHTKENILHSLLILDRVIGLEKITRLLIVSSPVHMRRCLLILKTFMPPWYQYVWCPDPLAIGQADTWWIDKTEERRVQAELFKVVNGVKEKHFIDDDVKFEVT